MSVKSNSLYLLLAGILLLQACSMRQQPLSEGAVKDEIISFTVDFIITNEIGEMADYIVTSGQPWVDSPPQASIIIYGPPATNSNDFSYVDIDNPIKVWWFADGQLIEADDKLKAIEQYQKEYMEDPSSDIFVWGYYTFGIVKIGPDFRSAEIQVEASCGPLCGHVVRYKIQRRSNGEWRIYDVEEQSVT